MSAKKATNLVEAVRVLKPEPLGPEDDAWYRPLPTPTPAGRWVPPLAMLREKLLNAIDGERLFLSGHIGSGKSTELRRLLRDPELLARFTVVAVSLTEAEQQSLTSHHLLFIVAAELFAAAKAQGLLGEGSRRWAGVLDRLDRTLFGPLGLRAKDAETEVTFDLVLFKLRHQLSLDEGRRVAFRQYAETDGTILVDLIDALVNEMCNGLAAKGMPAEVLVAIDGPDKLRTRELIGEVFDRNLGALLAPRVPMVMTVPASVSFGGPSYALGAKVTHLRPVQVLRRVKAADPMDALDRSALPYMHGVVEARVEKGLFDPRVVEEAAVYSGGVLRDFFGLLREAALQARVYRLDAVTPEVFTDVRVEARNAMVRGLYTDDFKKLLRVRDTKTLEGSDDLALMNASLVLEYNHTGVWWEANPLLWEGLAQ